MITYLVVILGDVNKIVTYNVTNTLYIYVVGIFKMIFMNLSKYIYNKPCFTYVCMLIAFFCILLNTSCSRSSGKESNLEIFHLKKTLSPKVQYLEGSSKQIDLLFLEHYYIIQSEVKAGQKQLAVYDLKSNEYLYSFVAKGHGQNEVIALDMFQNSKGDTLEIIDQAKYKTFMYKVGRKHASLLKTNYLKLPSVGPLQEVYRHNDSVIVFNTLDGKLQTYNEDRNKIIFVYDICDSLGVESKDRGLISYNFAYFKNSLCIGFRHINALLKGEVKEHGKVIISDINKVKKQLSKSDVKKYYYSYVDMNDGVILAQFMGYEMDFISKAESFVKFSPKFEIEIYSLNLNPKIHIVSQNDMLRCKLSKTRNCFYSWDPLDAKENISIYNY